MVSSSTVALQNARLRNLLNYQPGRNTMTRLRFVHRMQFSLLVYSIDVHVS